MKAVILSAFLFLAQAASAQSAVLEHERFCKNLTKVFESGRKENFESITGNERQSALLTVPGYTIKIEPFGIVYVDKDHRFVGQTKWNLDSLSALQKMDELEGYIATCLDSTWKWSEQLGDDTTTVFFKEHKQRRASTTDLNLSLAMDIVAPHVYTINLYIKRNGKPNTPKR